MTDPEQIDQQYYYDRPAMKPTARTYVRHFALLVITFFTSMVAGVMFPFGPINTLPDDDPQTAAQVLEFIINLPVKYAGLIGSTVNEIVTNPAVLSYGLKFSLSLIFILFCHEMGHYIACRLYRVDATLPFFIPTPPLIGPAGTFGAFIKIMSPMPSRRAVFDIGVAGPIAGFIALIPIALTGVATMEIATPAQVASSQGGLIFSDPIFMRMVSYLFGVDLNFGIGNAFYFAAWVGLLVTALNLIPSGQLDGGHAIYAVFGKSVHKWTGRIAFPVMAILSIFGMYFFNSPSGFLIAIILAVMMRVGHPEPLDQSPLDAKRKVIAFATLVIFALCFVPFPIRIS
ncbi:MAG: site-2 protease family protein [Pyrinomonadaceae bacterium]|nr:site-2 protease family protein [Pyrinomonadaceae bacterium]